MQRNEGMVKISSLTTRRKIPILIGQGSNLSILPLILVQQRNKAKIVWAMLEKARNWKKSKRFYQVIKYLIKNCS
jgi:hypothetical protein